MNSKAVSNLRTLESAATTEWLKMVLRNLLEMQEKHWRIRRYEERHLSSCIMDNGNKLIAKRLHRAFLFSVRIQGVWRHFNDLFQFLQRAEERPNL